jgi:hypothetical protein
MITRTLSRRLERLEARFTPDAEPLEFEIRFIGQKGEVESILLLRGDQQEWKTLSKDAVAGVLHE